MTALSWPTAAIILGAFALLAACAYLDHAAIGAIVGGLSTLAAGFAPRLLGSKGSAP